MRETHQWCSYQSHSGTSSGQSYIVSPLSSRNPTSSTETKKGHSQSTPTIILRQRHVRRLSRHSRHHCKQNRRCRRLLGKHFLGIPNSDLQKVVQERKSQRAKDVLGVSYLYEMKRGRKKARRRPVVRLRRGVVVVETRNRTGRRLHCFHSTRRSSCKYKSHDLPAYESDSRIALMSHPGVTSSTSNISPAALQASFNELSGETAAGSERR
jgi:hypothetical protein